MLQDVAILGLGGLIVKKRIVCLNSCYKHFQGLNPCASIILVKIWGFSHLLGKKFYFFFSSNGMWFYIGTSERQ